MFKDIITQTPFTTQAAEEYFSRVTSETFGGDVSLVSTLRALVFPRMGENDTLHVKFGNSSYNASAIASVDVTSAIHSICISWDFSRRDCLMIHSLNNAKSENNMACIELLRRKFQTVYSGWQLFDDITALMRGVANVLCFINAEKRSTVIFVDKLDCKKLHYLQAAILGLVPWYYKMGTAVTTQEMNLMQSLRSKDASLYQNCLKELVTQFDFEKLRLKRLLSGFETRQARADIQRINGEIENYRRGIGDLSDRIAEYVRAMNERCIQVMGIEQSVERNKDNSELLDYFLCNRRVVLEDVRGTTLSFYVKDYLEYYDEEMVQSALRNSYSYVYQFCTEEMNEARMKKLMTAVFLEGKIRLRIIAAYSFDINGNITPRSYHEFGSDYETYIPNPHINRYQCMGNYSSTINRLIRDRNYVAAIEQTVASAKSLNWGDSTVMRAFFRSIVGTEDSCRNNRGFELPDGRIVTPLEAVQWLEEQENERTEENHE